ncbi:hypothetical protein Poli38472_002859 [Pythium oligandrum]|uniref:Uncharacterized protein n=1 Tax=Pythium oligandrum TaxID=41045 RepID=A0A8K1C5H9_PYTOL|nr:hypothetical protein Poli38472_002859 [Pythium oligandrum]|eukprot:TMW56934.1 hypothetical protein Poli38472_002859 [Pythium oligandrum]
MGFGRQDLALTASPRVGKRVFSLMWLLVLAFHAVTSFSSDMGVVVSAERAYSMQYAHPPFRQPPMHQGCAMCRGTGNCSNAVENAHEGVYCGDLVTTFEPCCCTYRNECMTTIFSERCECLSDEEVEQFMSARFTVFCVFTAIMWIFLLYDKMCARPYKVANSNQHHNQNQHHILANTPSAARSTAPRESAGDQELLEIDHVESDAEGESNPPTPGTPTEEPASPGTPTSSMDYPMSSTGLPSPGTPSIDGDMIDEAPGSPKPIPEESDASKAPKANETNKIATQGPSNDDVVVEVPLELSPRVDGSIQSV